MSLQSENDLQLRRPVWETPSSLYLDTDTSLLREGRARLLASSPFDVQELERILVAEVHPVCRWNALAVAGVWDSFDLDWLEERIVSRQHSFFRFLS